MRCARSSGATSLRESRLNRSRRRSARDAEVAAHSLLGSRVDAGHGDRGHLPGVYEGPLRATSRRSGADLGICQPVEAVVGPLIFAAG